MLSRDPAAERFILQELASNDVQRELAAVRLAESTRGQAVIDKLCTLLDGGGINYHPELKHAIVTTLAAIGEARTLPRLERVLRSRNLFHPVEHNRLKHEIVSSLARYPAAAARSLIEEFGASGNPGASDQSATGKAYGGKRNDP